jgi:hypothetical protein
MATAGTKKGQEYSDAELALILSIAPTKRNAKRLADAFDRTPKAIEWIWSLASRTGKKVRSNWPSNKFVQQVRIAAKSAGWVH